MSIQINDDLSAFKAFTIKAGNLDTVAEISRTSKVVSSTHTAGALSRAFAVTSGAQAAKAANNHARQMLVNALKRQFNAESFAALPEAVKAALRGTHASTAEEDFAFAAGTDTVTSGKPLTARRIRAVLTAIENLPPAAHPNRGMVTEEMITQRQAALGPHLATLLGKLTTPPASWALPMVAPRFRSVAETALNGPLKKTLSQIGTGKTTIESARHAFALLSGAMGVIPIYWSQVRIDDNGNPTPGMAERIRLYEQFFNELVTAFNAENPDLAL